MQKIGIIIIKVWVSSVLNKEKITLRFITFELLICRKKIVIFVFYIKIFIDSYFFINKLRMPPNGKDPKEYIFGMTVKNCIIKITFALNFRSTTNRNDPNLALFMYEEDFYLFCPKFTNSFLIEIPDLLNCSF